MLAYPNVVTRRLSSHERRIRSEAADTPLVIEARDERSPRFLSNFLRENSARVVQDLNSYGALLLRGFDVPSAAIFEQQILSISGLCPVREVFLSEDGRTSVPGTRYVLHTNSLYKTGGTLEFGNFHTECYFTPDVVRYVAFVCLTPSRVGGETGLVNTANVYRDLPKDSQRRLADRACLVGLHTLGGIASRYDVSVPEALAFCEESGLPVITLNGVQQVCICKPSVIRHPMTGEDVLQVNFGVIPTLRDALIAAFLPDYRGVRWMLNRLLWRVPALGNVSHPSVALRMLRSEFRKRYRRWRRPSHATQSPVPLLRDLLGEEEVKSLAASMRRHFSSFTWQRGDILLIDNLRMAHSGMAGFGPRELRTLMCNPVVLPRSATASGHFEVKDEAVARTLGEALLSRSIGSVAKVTASM